MQRITGAGGGSQPNWELAIIDLRDSLVAYLPELVFALLRVDEGDSAVALPEADQDIDAHVVGFSGFHVEIYSRGFIG